MPKSTNKNSNKNSNKNIINITIHDKKKKRKRKTKEKAKKSSSSLSGTTIINNHTFQPMPYAYQQSPQPPPPNYPFTSQQPISIRMPQFEPTSIQDNTSIIPPTTNTIPTPTSTPIQPTTPTQFPSQEPINELNYFSSQIPHEDLKIHDDYANQNALSRAFNTLKKNKTKTNNKSRDEDLELQNNFANQYALGKAFNNLRKNKNKNKISKEIEENKKRMDMQESVIRERARIDSFQAPRRAIYEAKQAEFKKNDATLKHEKTVVNESYNNLVTSFQSKLAENPNAKLTREEKKQLGDIYSSNAFGHALTGNTVYVSKALQKLESKQNHIKESQKTYRDYDKEVLKEKTARRSPSKKANIHNLPSQTNNNSNPSELPHNLETTR
jgi:hypothetical protein